MNFLFFYFFINLIIFILLVLIYSRKIVQGIKDLIKKANKITINDKTSNKAIKIPKFTFNNNINLNIIKFIGFFIMTLTTLLIMNEIINNVNEILIEEGSINSSGSGYMQNEMASIFVSTGLLKWILILPMIMFPLLMMKKYIV